MMALNTKFSADYTKTLFLSCANK